MSYVLLPQAANLHSGRARASDPTHSPNSAVVGWTKNMRIPAERRTPHRAKSCKLQRLQDPKRQKQTSPSLRQFILLMSKWCKNHRLNLLLHLFSLEGRVCWGFSPKLKLSPCSVSGSLPFPRMLQHLWASFKEHCNGSCAFLSFSPQPLILPGKGAQSLKEGVPLDAQIHTQRLAPQ